jgi:hypothetical protein
MIGTTTRWIKATFARDEMSFRFGRPQPQRAASNFTREEFMREQTFTIPEIGMIAGTRVALGAGLGLLLSEKLSRDARRGAGCALLIVGALSTIPIVLGILGRLRAPAPESS